MLNNEETIREYFRLSRTTASNIDTVVLHNIKGVNTRGEGSGPPPHSSIAFLK